MGNALKGIAIALKAMGNALKGIAIALKGTGMPWFGSPERGVCGW